MNPLRSRLHRNLCESTILTDSHDRISHWCRVNDEISDERWSVIHPVWEDRNRLRGVLLVVSVSKQLTGDLSRLHTDKQTGMFSFYFTVYYKTL